MECKNCEYEEKTKGYSVNAKNAIESDVVFIYSKAINDQAKSVNDTNNGI